MIVKRKSLLAACTLALAASFSVHAADYPSKPVKITVGFAPGGAADVLARQVANKLQEQAGQTFIVENRPGATGTIAANATMQSAADGYSLMIASQSTMIMAPILYNSVTIDTLKDFQPVSQLVNLPLVLVVHPEVKASTVDELLALTRSTPMHYASSGAGGPQHSAAEYFKYLSKTEIDHVPYNGEATALNDVLAGQVPMMFVNLPVVAQHVKAGKLKALAITSPERSRDLPDVPSITEVPGMEDFNVETWYGIFAPAGTPEAVVGQLESQLQKAMNSDELQSKLNEQGFRIVGSSSKDFTAFIEKEIPRWTDLATSTNMKVD